VGEVAFWLGAFLLAYIENHDFVLCTMSLYFTQKCGGDFSCCFPCSSPGRTLVALRPQATITYNNAQTTSCCTLTSK